MGEMLVGNIPVEGDLFVYLSIKLDKRTGGISIIHGMPLANYY